MQHTCCEEIQISAAGTVILIGWVEIPEDGCGRRRVLLPFYRRLANSSLLVDLLKLSSNRFRGTAPSARHAANLSPSFETIIAIVCSAGIILFSYHRFFYLAWLYIFPCCLTEWGGRLAVTIIGTYHEITKESCLFPGLKLKREIVCI